MLLTVFCAPRDRSETTFALDVSPELELRDFLALCELESGIPAREIQVNIFQTCSNSYLASMLSNLTKQIGAKQASRSILLIAHGAYVNTSGKPQFSKD